MSGLYTGSNYRDPEDDFDDYVVIDDSDIDSVYDAPEYVKEKSNDTHGRAHTPKRSGTAASQAAPSGWATTTWVAVAVIAAVACVYIAALVASSKSVDGINNATAELHKVATASSSQVAETARTSPDKTTKNAAVGAHQIIRSMAASEQGRVSSTTSADDAARILGLPLGLCTVTENIQNVANQGTADIINECNRYNESISHYGSMANMASILPLVNAPSVLD